MKYIKLTFLILMVICLSCQSEHKDNYNENLVWAVELTLKPQTDENYLPTEDPEIKALVLKHGVEFRQSAADTTLPELMPYYQLRGKGSMSKESRENIIKAFLATGKFEDYVREFGIANTC
jgi:hypothetical protein